MAEILAVAVLASPLAAQARQASKLDRTKVPEAGKTPELRVPAYVLVPKDRGPSGRAPGRSRMAGCAMAGATWVAARRLTA